MRGVCALNMEAMTVFRSGGNGLAPANLEDVGSDAGQEEPEVVGSDTELTTHLPPSHSAPITHHHGTQTNILQSHSAHPHQTPQSTAHFALPHTLSSSHHTTSAIATSSVQVQTSSQAKVRSLAASRGRSSVGMTSHRRGRGQTRPAVMVERHNLG